MRRSLRVGLTGFEPATLGALTSSLFRCQRNARAGHGEGSVQSDRCRCMPERSHPEIEVQPIALDEVDAAVETITLAFQTDPVWRGAPARPRAGAHPPRPPLRGFLYRARRPP